MISDEPDEDADPLDDEELLETYLAPEILEPGTDTDNAPRVMDWPPPRARGAGPTIDAQTFAWFSARHADWQEEIGRVLRAWIAAKSRPRPDTEPPQENAAIQN